MLKNNYFALKHRVILRKETYYLVRFNVGVKGLHSAVP